MNIDPFGDGKPPTIAAAPALNARQRRTLCCSVAALELRQLPSHLQPSYNRRAAECEGDKPPNAAVLHLRAAPLAPAPGSRRLEQR